MTEPLTPSSPTARHEPVDTETAIREQILPRDTRYEIAAYLFLYEALAYTQKALGRTGPDLRQEEKHVSGKELLEGIREYAARQFGPLAPTVFRSWGIRRTEDFGEIVFNLVESKLLGKTQSDSRDDFADGFDFDRAFDGPFSAEIR